MISLEWHELLLRLGVAAFLGAIVGLDRQLRHKPTGLRTALISVGSALLTLVALEMSAVTAREGYDSAGDVGRLLQGLVSGIGILGAGVFLHQGSTTRHATTGASVWLAGIVGIASVSVSILRRQRSPFWCWLVSGLSNVDFSSRTRLRPRR